MKKNRVVKAGMLMAVLLALSGTAKADSVLLGSDYFETLPGTYFDFGPPIGIVPLIGLPINPLVLGTTDTIVQRQSDAGPTFPDTVPIEIVQLSLVSAAPVVIGGTPYDVVVQQDTLNPSIGTMTIRHEGVDNGGPAPEGTFDSFFDVFITADFTEVGNPLNTFSLSLGPLRLDATGTPWSHEPMLPGTLLVTGPAGDQDANDHTSKPAFTNDFHVQQVTEIKLPPLDGRHIVKPAQQPVPPLIPEPAGMVLIVAGLALGATGRRTV